jgi:hypothetical protein
VRLAETDDGTDEVELTAPDPAAPQPLAATDGSHA